MEGAVNRGPRPAAERPAAMTNGMMSPFERSLRHNPDAFATPCYIYNPDIVAARYRALRDALRTKLIVSLKANPNSDLFSRCYHEFIDGVEVASQMELNVVVGRFRAPKFVNNPSMDVQFLRAALASRVTVIVDNLNQVDMLIAEAGQLKPMPVLLRLNVGVSNVIPSGAADHFGMDLAEARAAARRLRDAAIEVAGCHFFAGSSSFGLRSGLAAKAVMRAAEAIESELDRHLTTVNFGGGFVSAWDDHPAAVINYSAELQSLHTRYTLVHEAGRAIFGKAGAFVTRVVATKILNGQSVVICDGGIAQNFLLCQTENVLRRRVSPTVITAAKAVREIAAVPVLIAGSTCSKSDVLGQCPTDSVVPQPGDICLFENCGAYNHTYTVANFLGSKQAIVYITG